MSTTPKITKTYRIGGPGGGNPPKYLRAKVVNILPSGVVMVNLLAKPLDKNLRSAGPLTGPKPLDIKVGDIVDVLPTRSGFDFVRIAEKAVLSKPIETKSYPPIYPANVKRDDAAPKSIEFEDTKENRPARPAIPSVPARPIAQVPSGVYKTIPTMLDSAADVSAEGKRIKALLIKQPSDEIRTKALQWIDLANEMVACFNAETSKKWTSSLVRRRGEIISIAETITKISKLLGRTPSELRIPVPVDMAMDITPKVEVGKTSAPQPPALKLSPEEEELRRIFDKHGLNTPIVRLFIEVQSLLHTGFKVHRTLEQIRSVLDTVKMLMAEGRFDAECNAGEFESHIEINRELYRRTFEEFAAKFDRYLNVKDIDPERLIDNYFRTSKIKPTLDGCCFYDRKRLEKGQLDGSDKERIRDLTVWLKFLLSGDNLTAEYPELKNKPERVIWHKALFREALAVLKKYSKAD